MMNLLEMDVKIALWMGTHRIECGFLVRGKNESVGMLLDDGKWCAHKTWPFFSGYLDYMKEAEVFVQEEGLEQEYALAVAVYTGDSHFDLIVASACQKALALCNVIDSIGEKDEG